LNGRVEGYINARAFNPDEMSATVYYPKIATALALLHNQDIPELGVNDDWLWEKVALFFKLAEGKPL
jgi:hypothetical protein